MPRLSRRAMLLAFTLTCLFLSHSSRTLGNTDTQFRLSSRGAALLQTEGIATQLSSGFARIRTEPGSFSPAGVAIFGLRQNGVLITEAAVPAAVPSTSGRIYAEIGSGIDTGLAIANPNDQPAEVSFYFTNADGDTFGSGKLDIPANGKIARFLSEEPFSASAPLRGAFTYTSTSPVAVTALRGNYNARSEFLITTLPVAPTSSTVTGTSYIPHFADGLGWTTQVILVNPTETLLTGTIRFAGKGSESTVAPILSDTTYRVPPRGSFRLITNGTGPTTETGSVRVFPATAGEVLPVTMTIFSYTRNGLVVSEAGIAGVPGGPTYRIYTEVSGNFAAGQIGAIQTGFAITNLNAAQNTLVALELATLAGVTIRTATITIPARGQIAIFLSEIPAFSDLPLPFYGVLRLRSTSTSNIAVTGLRLRYNERTEFLLASTPPVLESTAPVAEIVFPHIADGGGFYTQFILLSNSRSESAAGSLAFYGPTGAAFTSQLRSIVPSKPSVTLLSAGALISEPANLFDLEGKTLRFTPSGSTYSVQSMPLSFDETAGIGLNNSAATRGGQFPQVLSWPVTLSFPLSFGGQTFNSVFVNSYGSISFGAPESESTARRDPWPNATMKSNAAAIDSLSAGGLEKMIAVFWSMYDSGLGTASVVNTVDELTVTWRVTRNNRYVTPLGVNVFQAKLRRNGTIDLSYKQISERDGITGFFTGYVPAPVTLDQLDRNSTANPMVRVNSVNVADMGSIVRLTLNVGSPIVNTVSSGEMDYRIALRIAGRDCTYQVGATTSGRYSSSSCHGAQPQAFGYRVDGSTLEMYMSKVVLGGATAFSWAFDVVYFGPTTIFENSLGAYRSVTIPASPRIDLSSINGVLTGPALEVFHYPVMSRNPAEALTQIYQYSPPVDDLALVLTDFRYDEIFGGEGPSYSPSGNDRIDGIASNFGAGTAAVTFGSRQLLVTPSPAYIGHPPFDERVFYDGRQFINYGFSVVWVAHEMTHHWVTRVRFRNPSTGNVEPLHDGTGHWTTWLHAPSYRDVSLMYSTNRFVQSSPMGSSSWVDNLDGTFTQNGLYFRNISGFSALDLYLMGMLPAEEIPETFLLKDPTLVGAGRYQATKVPVRVQDIIAAEGPRVPAAADSQKVFRLGVYLLSDPTGNSNPAMLSRAEGLTHAVIQYFDAASGGRMKVIQ